MVQREHILRAAESLLPEIVEIRRHIHQHPELSFTEYETAAYISSKLGSMGIEHRTGIAGTGIVGFIRGEAAGRGLTIGLRADMDALPITEAGEKEYRSRNEGAMHACGHDAHVAMLLGTANIIRNLRKEFAGTVLLVFQPGEEKAPGGARMMIETGFFKNYAPDMFIAQHVLPDLPQGRSDSMPALTWRPVTRYISLSPAKAGMPPIPHSTLTRFILPLSWLSVLRIQFLKKARGRRPPCWVSGRLPAWALQT